MGGEGTTRDSSGDLAREWSSQLSPAQTIERFPIRVRARRLGTNATNATFRFTSGPFGGTRLFGRSKVRRAARERCCRPVRPHCLPAVDSFHLSPHPQAHPRTRLYRMQCLVQGTLGISTTSEAMTTISRCSARCHPFPAAAGPHRHPCTNSDGTAAETMTTAMLPCSLFLLLLAVPSTRRWLSWH